MKKILYSFIVLSIALSLVTGCKRKSTPRDPVLYGQIQRKSSDFFDTKPSSKQASYIYAPGMMGSEMLLARLCPHFIATTGEEVTCASGGHVIGQPYSVVIFPEVDLSKPGGFTLNPLKAWFDQIYLDLFPLAQRVMQESYKFEIKIDQQSSTSVMQYTFNFGRANIAQKKDIKTFNKVYSEHVKKYPNSDIVLYGDSRGAATIFNFIAVHKPAHVKAAIVEGVFDTVEHSIKHFLYSDKDKKVEDRLHYLIELFMGSYNKKGPFPRDYAEIITDDIPLLLVTSLKDGLVAPQSTFYLYKRLRERGHQKVHLLVLKDSLHPCYMIDNAQDRQQYETTVHAFYKQYGLPYNAVKATQGQRYFAKTQPSAKDLTNYHLSICPHC